MTSKCRFIQLLTMDDLEVIKIYVNLKIDQNDRYYPILHTFESVTL